MKLYPSQRSKLAEAICRRIVRRHRIKLKVLPVYVIRHKRETSHVWGYCYYRNKIILHLGAESCRRDWYILLCHEFAHHLDNCITPPRHRKNGHGETFQRILWGLVPRSLWKRASSGQWVRGVKSDHKPQFQPIDREPEPSESLQQEAA